MFDLLLITPELAPDELVRRAERTLRAAAQPGRIAVQLRVRRLDRERKRWLALMLRALTREYGASLLINRDLEVAREVGADGVQLPELGPTVAAAITALGPTCCIGASRHDLAGVLSAAADGASFVTLSPIFSVPDKGSPLGSQSLARIAVQTEVAIIALGGVTATNAPAVVRAGARGLAVIRAGLGSDHPVDDVRALLDAIDRGRQRPPE